MKIIDLEKAESQLGDLVNIAQTGAVAVRERDGRITVLLPMKEYEHFARLGDVYWVKLAEETIGEIRAGMRRYKHRTHRPAAHADKIQRQRRVRQPRISRRSSIIAMVSLQTQPSKSASNSKKPLINTTPSAL